MKDAYKKSVEEFDFKFGYEQPLYFSKQGEENILYPVDRFKSFLKHHSLALIDAEIDAIEKINPSKVADKNFPDEDEDVLVEVTNGAEVMKNRILTHLKEQRELIDKQN